MSDKSRVIIPLIKDLYAYIKEYEESLEKGIVEYENECLNTKKGQGKLTVGIRFDSRTFDSTGEYDFKIKFK